MSKKIKSSLFQSKNSPSRHPELSRSLVRLMIGLAPVTMPANPKSPIKFLMPVADQIERMLSITGNSEFGSNDGFLSDLKSSLCGQVTMSPSLHV